MQKYIKRFFESAIETAFIYIWTGVLTMILALFSFLLKGGGKGFWLFASGFISASIIIIGLSVLLVFIKSYRYRKLESIKDAQFLSKDKGILDHRVDMENATKELTRILLVLSKEINKIGNTLNKAIPKIQSTRENPIKAQKIISDTAKKLNKHSAKMEGNIPKFDEIINLLIESTTAYFTWFVPKIDQEKQELITLRQTCTDMLSSTQLSLSSMESYHNIQVDTKGISQDLNTALNRSIFVTDNTITIMKKAKQHWHNLIEILNKKL